MSFFARRGHMCYRNDGIFFIIFGDGEVSEKFPLRGLPFARLRLWPTASGGYHAAKSCVGGLSRVWKCCGGCKRLARVSGVCPPSRTALPLAAGGGKQTRGVYTEGILLWVWPGCCSKVFLWADLTQPGG